MMAYHLLLDCFCLLQKTSGSGHNQGVLFQSLTPYDSFVCCDLGPRVGYYLVVFYVQIAMLHHDGRLVLEHREGKLLVI